MNTKVCKDCGEDKPHSEYYKRKDTRDGLYSRCKGCHNSVTSKTTKIWYLKNKDSRVEYNKNYYENNKHSRLEENRTRAKQWYWDNRHKAIKRVREREVLQKEATPTWLTEDQLEEMKYLYDQATDCAVVCGEPYEVDHIVPIKHDLVCGLNVPWNLQVLPMHVNRAKSNKFDGGW